MRNAFIQTLVSAARQDSHIWLLVGDLGFSVVEPFQREFPDRFVNVGVAEQNLAGIAAGLALSGKTVFTYSIANFPTLRCLEQIRNDICYHRASVKIVAVGGGLAYGALGMTHHATEDLAIMRALPDMVVAAPGDPVEAGLVTQAAAREPGPFYIRLGKAGERVLHSSLPVLKVGQALWLRDGRDITLIATGGLLESAVQAADELAKQGVSVRVLSLPFVKPLDAAAVRQAARETRAILSIEEHSVSGGLGGAVAEVLAEYGRPVRFACLGLPDAFCQSYGSQEYMRQNYGLSPQGIMDKARTLLA